MAIPTITVNEDIKCPQCGKPGACKADDGEYGLCLECVTKVAKKIRSISMEMSKTQTMVEAEVKNLINTEWPRITKAYENSCYEIGVSIKISLAGNNEKISIITELAYYPLPKMKIKNDPVVVDEKQISLPLKKVG